MQSSLYCLQHAEPSSNHLQLCFFERFVPQISKEEELQQGEQSFSVGLTSTCQMFSLAPSKLQKRTLAPSRPWPPHMLLGVTSSSLMRWVFELYTSSLTAFSTLAFRRSFSKSLFLFWRRTRTPRKTHVVFHQQIQETTEDVRGLSNARRRSYNLYKVLFCQEEAVGFLYVQQKRHTY